MRKETFTIDLSNPLGVDERLWGHTVTLYGASLVTSIPRETLVMGRGDRREKQGWMDGWMGGWLDEWVGLTG
ncbi:hypothetical protein V1477_012997 [Vespula maculifrons]|uniref:Uncharacterized protein n=1 Tax=Vespula maculifrons TaxID=7453 RepID=A0ABD2BW54_VESMC